MPSGRDRPDPAVPLGVVALVALGGLTGLAACESEEIEPDPSVVAGESAGGELIEPTETIETTEITETTELIEQTEAAEITETTGTTGEASGTGVTHPDVVDVAAEFDESAGTWSFAVTISSPYDGPERYADGWRVVGPDGTVFGVHTLLHHHAGEQPFTRRQTGVAIPDDVETVVVEGRDLVNGFGGTTMTVDLHQTGRR